MAQIIMTGKDAKTAKIMQIEYATLVKAARTLRAVALKLLLIRGHLSGRAVQDMTHKRPYVKSFAFRTLDL
jgi:hypothetical protein